MSHLTIVQPYLLKITSPEDQLDKSILNEILEKLEPYIANLLKGNMNDVFSLLYKLDVAEEKVKYILFGDHNEPTSKLLAEAILQREIVRRIYRLKYSTQ